MLFKEEELGNNNENEKLNNNSEEENNFKKENNFNKDNNNENNINKENDLNIIMSQEEDFYEEDSPNLIFIKQKGINKIPLVKAGTPEKLIERLVPEKYPGYNYYIKDFIKIY